MSQIARTCHRSVDNLMIDLLTGSIAYTHQPKKRSLNSSDELLALLPTTLSNIELGLFKSIGVNSEGVATASIAQEEDDLPEGN